MFWADDEKMSDVQIEGRGNMLAWKRRDCRRNVHPSSRLQCPADQLHFMGNPGRGIRVKAVMCVVCLAWNGCGSPDDEARRIQVEDSAQTTSVARGSSDTIRIADAPSCRDCGIELINVATIGSEQPPGSLTDQARIWRGHDGRFYVRDVTTAPAQVLVYDEAGRYLTAFGRNGQGPGEYTAHWNLIPRSEDTLQILDWLQRRVTTVTTPDYTVVGVERIPLLFSEYALLEDGGMVVHGMLATRAAMGYPLHDLGPAFEVRASFGTDDPRYDPTDPTTPSRVERRLAAATGDEYWVARHSEFVVELWNRAGAHLRTYARSADWFTVSPTGYPPPWIGPPTSKLESIRQDEAGRLWVLVWTADPNWEPREPYVSTELGGHEGYLRYDNHYWYDTVIEIWAPGEAQLVASTRSDLQFRGFIEGGYVYSVRTDDLGVSYFDVWRPQITILKGAER